MSIGFILPNKVPLDQLVYSLVLNMPLPVSPPDTDHPYNDPSQRFFGEVILRSARYNPETSRWYYRGEIIHGRSVPFAGRHVPFRCHARFEMCCSVPSGDTVVDIFR